MQLTAVFSSLHRLLSVHYVFLGYYMLISFCMSVSPMMLGWIFSGCWRFLFWKAFLIYTHREKAHSLVQDPFFREHCSSSAIARLNHRADQGSGCSEPGITSPGVLVSLFKSQVLGRVPGVYCLWFQCPSQPCHPRLPPIFLNSREGS